MRRNASQNRLSLDEYARIEPETFSLLNHQTFDLGSVEAAVSESRRELISILRTDNLYPPRGVMDKIADAIAGMIGSGKLDAAEVISDDLESLKGKGKRIHAPEPIEAEIPEIETAEEGIDTESVDIPHPASLTESAVDVDDLFPFDEVA
jgi:hypothetical protein